jgi:hypothetical protein
MYNVLRIWVFKSGVLKKIFIFSKQGTKANIRSTKMANNRHAYDRDVLQSYWTSEWLSLCCSQPTMTLIDLSPADFRRFLTVLVDRRLLGSQCCFSTGLVANGIHLTTRRDVLQSYWTSEWLSLYCSQPTGEKTHTSQQCERLAKIRQTSA